ncbi:PAS domain-containing protein [Lampropedia cohaerens]|uniref:PAS domain-containing protein n=1 Tax=Lampropedia cohaerens TaxID=1610491 RepID=UPI00069AAC5B|nr:PAS domain-containing protein [Lampropedia cohaerens]
MINRVTPSCASDEADMTREAMPSQPPAWLANLPIPALQLDRAGKILAGNAAWQHWMGTLHVGSNVSSLLHPEDRERWLKRFSTCLHAPLPPGHPAGMVLPNQADEEMRLLLPQHGIAWCQICLQQSADTVCMIAYDVTRYHRREAQLQASSRGLSSLLNSIPAMFYRGRNDREWSMEMVSEGCRLLTGYAPTDIEVGGRLHFSQLILPEYADYVWHGVQEALLHHRAFRLWYAITCADGSVRKVLEIGHGIYSRSNEVLGVEGMIIEHLDAPSTHLD